MKRSINNKIQYFARRNLTFGSHSYFQPRLIQHTYQINNGNNKCINIKHQNYSMLSNPSLKYPKLNPIKMDKRNWPNNSITEAPRWCSTDLRDGNDSLMDQMSLAQKIEFFDNLIKLGFKEIEIASPFTSTKPLTSSVENANNDDLEFIKYVKKNVPDDVNIQVLVDFNQTNILNTINALKGIKRVTIHVCLPTSDKFREIVLGGITKEELVDKAKSITALIKSLTKQSTVEAIRETTWSYQFSTECFNDTNIDFSLEVCNEITKIWEPSEENPIIFNLPATVELSTPNCYADQIESFSSRINNREKVCISAHTHNDRGCAVAATELALLAGADRVEGCLFGNGERTGNVDIVTVALNLYSQGIAPKLDFSDMKSVIEMVERCNKIPIGMRAPYAGDLVYCAFDKDYKSSIRKGFKLQDWKRKMGDHVWQIPYLPMDPKDIGRDYEPIIRVNSALGKNGNAEWIILRSLGLELPKQLQLEFSNKIFDYMENYDTDLNSAEVTKLFKKSYNYNMESHRYISLLDYDVKKIDSETRVLTGLVEINDKVIPIKGTGNGPISSLVNALSNLLNIKLNVENYNEHSIGSGSSTQAASYIQLRFRKPSTNERLYKWGVSVSEDVGDSSVGAIFATVNNIIHDDCNDLINNI